MQLKPLAKPSTLIPAALATELGDRITVVRHPIQGGTISRNTSIRSVEHTIGNGDWTTTFGLTFK